MSRRTISRSAQRQRTEHKPLWKNGMQRRVQRAQAPREATRRRVLGRSQVACVLTVFSPRTPALLTPSPAPQGRLAPGPDGVHGHGRGAESAQPPRFPGAEDPRGAGAEAAAHQPAAAGLPQPGAEQSL